MRVELETRPVGALQAYSRNSRTHSRIQVERIASSLEEFGMVGAIVVRDGVIAKGHGTLEAVRLLYGKGRKLYPPPGESRGAHPFPEGEVPVLDASGWSEDQFRAYVIADNKLAEEAGWDLGLLAVEFGHLIGTGFDVSLTGFNVGEIDRVLAKGRPAGKTDPDDAPELAQVAVSQPGDGLLGEHRVMCGDSTKAETLARLASDARAPVLFTDPPYGVSYRDTGAGAWNEAKLAKKKAGTLKPRFQAIAADELTGEELAQFWASFLTAALPVMSPRAAFYCCYASLRAPEVFAAYAKAGIQPRAELVWVKSRPGFNFSHYKHQHEPLLYGVRKGKPAPWYGDETQTTLLEVASEPGKDYVHPTQKPVGLLERPLGNSSKPGEHVLDPFLGSGTTLIACERLGRRCLGLELDPRYVDVAVMRWQGYAGKEAQLEQGGTFAMKRTERAKAAPPPPPPSKETVH